MPIGAEQWRVKTGMVNASRGHRQHSIKHSQSLCDLPIPPPPSDWKGYSLALTLLCLPLLYKIYALGATVMMYLVRGVNYGLDAQDSYSMTDAHLHHGHRSGVLLLLLSITSYLTMTLTAFLMGVHEYRERNKHQLVLIHPLHHLKFLCWFNMEGGAGGGLQMVPKMVNGCVYATLVMDPPSTLQCVRTSVQTVNRKATGISATFVSFVLQLSTIALAMLLLLGGDVERNPGPSLGLDDIMTLVNELKLAESDYYNIGLQLGVKQADIQSIKNNYYHSERRLTEILLFWLRGNTDVEVCWESIIDALIKVHRKTLARELMEKYFSALVGPIEMVKYFITELGCDPNRRGEHETVLLHAAAQGGNVQIMKYLTDEKKCDPAVCDEFGRTPLHYAAECGHLDCVKFLTITKKCAYRSKCVDGHTPLHLAVSNGHMAVVRFFISELGCSPNIQGQHKATPLHVAAQYGQLEVMKYLIDDQECNPSATNVVGSTPLHLAAGSGKLNCVKYLTLEKACDPNCRTLQGNAPLHAAVEKNQREIVNFFIVELKCDPCIQGMGLATPLHLAIKYGNLDMVKVLLKHKAVTQLTTPDAFDRTPIHVATLLGHTDILSYLEIINKKSEPTPISYMKSTHLQYGDVEENPEPPLSEPKRKMEHSYTLDGDTMIFHTTVKTANKSRYQPDTRHPRTNKMTKDAYVLLQDRLYFPTFSNLPSEDNFQLYDSDRHETDWMFMAEITNDDYSQLSGHMYRNRVFVCDRIGRNNIPVLFYHDTEVVVSFDFKALRKGHTLFVLRATKYRFRDFTIGLRIEDLSTVFTVPCGLKNLLECSALYDERKSTKCWSCSKQQIEDNQPQQMDSPQAELLDSSLKKCGTCKIARYCSKECQVKDWKERHRRWCKVLPHLSKLPKLYSKDKHLDAVKQAMERKGTLDHIIVNAVFLGPARSGKTSLIKQLTGDGPSESSPSTGVADAPILVQVKPITSMTLRVTDSAWYKLSYDKEAADLMCRIYNASEITAAETVTHIHQHSEESSPMMQREGKGLLEAKSTKKESHTSNTQVSDPKHSLPAGYKTPLEIMDAAARGEDVSDFFQNSWSLYLTDTGGQMEFQDLLPLLVSGPSVFFITFRLDQDLNQVFTVEYELPDGKKSEPYQSTLTVLEAILQSLASIASMGTFVYKSQEEQSVKTNPKVFLVGTHKDKLNQTTANEQIRKIDQILREKIESTSHYRDGLIEYANEQQLIFTVNNLSKDDADFKTIRMSFKNVVERGDFKTISPSHWLIFSLVIRLLTQRIIRFDECLCVAKECGITDEAELKEALHFLHTKLGVVRYFPKEDLSEIVIKDPQVLFDKVTELIVRTFTFKKVGKYPSDEFKNKGIFSLRDFERVSGDSSTSLTPTRLVKLLQDLRIVAPFPADDGETKFFIPCVLSHTEVCEAPQARQETDVPPLVVNFKCGYCPKGLSAALIVYLLTSKVDSKLEWKLEEKKIYRDQVSFHVGPDYDTIVLQLLPTLIKITFVCDTLCQATETDLRTCSREEVCASVRQSIVEGINRVAADMNYLFNVEPIIAFVCPCEDSEETKRLAHPAEIAWYKGKLSKRLLCSQTKQRFTAPVGCDIWFAHANCDHEISETKGGALLTLDKNHLEVKRLINDLSSDQICELGQELGLGYSKLKKMKDLPDDMVAAWLRQEDDVIKKSDRPTLNRLAEALNNVGQCGKAKKIFDSLTPCI